MKILHPALFQQIKFVISLRQVEFADGQTVATITITIRDDTLPEIDETTLITLTEIIEPGTNLPGKGAIIGTIGIFILLSLDQIDPLPLNTDYN